MGVPFAVQQVIWEYAVKTGEADAQAIGRAYPGTDQHTMMMLTTTLVRYIHHCMLDAARNTPIIQRAIQPPTEAINTFRAVLLTWADQFAQQVFDSTSGTVAVAEAAARAQAYRAELQAFPGVTALETDVIDFLVETDRRWYQYRAEALPIAQADLDRFRAVGSAVLRESIDAHHRANQMLEQARGFAKRAAKASRRHHN